MSRTVYRTCPLCEALCGLQLTVSGDRISGVRGDVHDPFSKGFICPKGATLGSLDGDPDRLSRPLVDGEPATWDEAFEAVRRGIAGVIAEHGPDAVAVYLGNPTAHSMAGPLYGAAMIKALGTRNIYSASTADQIPKHVSCGYLFGDPLAIPVPDLDRTDFLLMLGANPLESNGSLCSAPDFPGRLKALRARGGRLIVVDPRRTRTADLADTHLFIRPGTDAFFLAALAAVLFEEGLTRPTIDANGITELGERLAEFTPEATAATCGIDAARIREVARELAAAPRAAVYGRIGTCTQEFGTLASWLVDVLNVLTGNLDRPGGAMFSRPAHRPVYRKNRPFVTGRWHSRVRGLPEVMGELPVATLADEIDTPGGIRALVTFGGNPVLSAPNGARLDPAFAGLDFMVSVDPYLNETTRHASVVLPPPRPAQTPHYDFALLGLAVRDYVRYSPPVVPLPAGVPSESEIVARLATIFSGATVTGAATDAVDDLIISTTLRRAVAAEESPVAGRDPDELTKLLDGEGPERRLDLMLRLGPYGDGFGTEPDGLTLARLRDEHPHGLDLGPLEPRLEQVLATVSGHVELCPAPVIEDLLRLRSALREAVAPVPFVLIGRRHLRSNNSWLHNVPELVGGSNRCTLVLNASDAAGLGIEAGSDVRIRSRAGSVTAVAEPSEKIMPGVVSLPHGWGHDRPGTRTGVARDNAGVNVNALTDEQQIDPLSGNAVFNGVPVHIEPV
jgi:anaerobic selenocysteine-containing dehydrogenase